MIRQATTKDAQAIAGIHVQTWQFAYDGILCKSFLQGLSLERGAERWHDNLSKSTEGIFVAEEEGIIVGWISFGQSRDDDADLAGEVYAVYVQPECWGRGFGRRLMEVAETNLWRENCETITLWVLELNQRARAFYAKAGYSFDGTKKLICIGGCEVMEYRYARKTE